MTIVRCGLSFTKELATGVELSCFVALFALVSLSILDMSPRSVLVTTTYAAVFRMLYRN